MDETETDVDILLECLRYQNTDYQAVKRSLQALASVFNSDGNSKEYFRKVGGLQLTQRLLSADFPDDVLQAAVFCLACAVEDDVFCQNSLTKKETFEFLHGVLSERKGKERKWLQAATFLLVNLVANNSAGQQLAKESGVLADLLGIFRQTANRKRVGELSPDEVDFCVSVVTALSMCVNNPQNETNQRQCCTVLPLCFHMIVEDTWSPLTGSLLSFAGLTVAGNGFNQKRMKSSGGLDTLLQLLEGCEREVQQQQQQQQQQQHTASSSLPVLLVPAVISVINACISDCKENAQYFVEKGGVERVVTWLGGPHHLSPHHLLQLMLTLGYALEFADRTVAPLMHHRHQTLLVKLLTEAEDEELVRAIKYVLSAWQILDDGKQESCTKQKAEDKTTQQRLDRLARQIHQGPDRQHDRMEQGADEQTVRDDRQGTDRDKESTADQCPRARSNQYEVTAERSEGTSDHCGLKTREQREMTAHLCEGSRKDLRGQAVMGLQGCCSIEGAAVVSCDRHPFSGYTSNPDPAHPVTVAATRFPQADTGAARQALFAPVLAQTDPGFPSLDDRYTVRQPGSAPTTVTQAPAYFCPDLDTNGIRQAGFDHRSADVAPQDSSSFLAAYMSVPGDGRSGVRGGGDQGLHEHHACVQNPFSQHPCSSSFSALPVSSTSASLPQLGTATAAAAADSRSCQMLLHHPPHPTTPAAVALSQAQHPVPIYPTYPSVAGSSHPTLGQPASRPDVPQSVPPHHTLTMPTVHCSTVSHHQQQPCTGLSGTFPQQSEEQQNAGGINPQCPFSVSQGVQGTLPVVSCSQGARLPAFYFTKSPVSLPSASSQLLTASVSDPPPQCSVGQGGRGQTQHPLSVSVSHLPSTSLSQLCPYPHYASPPPYPPTDGGQPVVVEQKLSQFPSAPLTSDQLRAAPLSLSSSAVGPQSTGLVTLHSTAVPLSGGEGQQQGLSTGQLWRQVTPAVSGDGSSCVHNLSYLPPAQTQPYLPPASSSEWRENCNTATLSHCYGEGDQRYRASQGQQPSTVMLSQSDQPDPSSALRSSHTAPSGEPALAISTLAPQHAHCQSTVARPLPPHTSVFQQPGCLTSVHTSQYSVACPSDRDMTSSGENALTNALSLLRPTEVRGQTAAARSARGRQHAGVQESPPLITDTCQVTLEPDPERAQAAESTRNEKCQNMLTTRSEPIPSSLSKHMFTENKPSNQKGPDMTLTADALIKILDKREPDRSSHTPNPSGDHAAAAVLTHTKTEGVFRVPFPKAAGSRGSVQGDCQASPCVCSAGDKSPPLSVRRKGLRRAPSRTPDPHQPLPVTAPSPHSRAVSQEVARHLALSSMGDGDRMEICHNASTEQALASCREKQSTLTTQQAEKFKPVLAGSRLISSSPAASEFDFQLLKTAAQGIQTSQAGFLNGQKKAGTYDLTSKKVMRKGSPAYSMGSLEEVELGLDEEFANNDEFVPDSEDCDSEEEECHILHNFSQHTLSASETDSLSDTASCLSTVYSVTPQGVLSLQAAVVSGSDVAKVCPGCSSQQGLSSRSFNIAIETSSVTCPAHRTIRQLERDFIWRRACRGQKRKKLGHHNKAGHKKKVGHHEWRKWARRASLTLETGQGQPRNVKVMKGSSCYDSRNGSVGEGKTVVVNSDRKQCSPPPGSHRPLSMCEERRLKRAVVRVGQDWTAVLHSGHFARGRTAEELRDHWTRLCSDDVRVDTAV